MLNQERNWFFENKAVSLSGWLHKAHNRLVFFKLKKEQTLVFFAKSLPSNSTGSPVRLLHLKSSTGNMLMGSRCLQTTRFYFPQGRNSLDRNLATDVSKLYMQLFLLRHRAHICFQLTQTAAFKFYDDKCITKSRSISHQVWTNLNHFLFPPPDFTHNTPPLSFRFPAASWHRPLWAERCPGWFVSGAPPKRCQMPAFLSRSLGERSIFNEWGSSHAFCISCTTHFDYFSRTWVKCISSIEENYPMTSHKR